MSQSVALVASNPVLSTLKFRSARTLEPRPARLMPDYSNRATFAANDWAFDAEVLPPLFLQKPNLTSVQAADTGETEALPPLNPPVASSLALFVAAEPAPPVVKRQKYKSLAARLMSILSGVLAAVCLAGICAAGGLFHSMMSDVLIPDASSMARPIAFASPAMASNMRLGDRKIVRRRKLKGPVSFRAEKTTRGVPVATLPVAAAPIVQAATQTRKAEPVTLVISEAPAAGTQKAIAATGSAAGAGPAPAATEAIGPDTFEAVRKSAPPAKHEAAVERQRPRPARAEAAPLPDEPRRKKIVPMKPVAKAPVRRHADDDDDAPKPARRMQLGGTPAKREAPPPAAKEANPGSASAYGPPHPAWAREALFRD